MDILLHTIALEPARWTPQRVSRPLTELLLPIAAAGFRRLEIYEPHLTDASTSPEIKDALARLDLVPVILSSYLNLNPSVTPDAGLDAKLQQLRERFDYYGFEKLRLFPGPGMNGEDKAAIAIFIDRLKRLAGKLSNVEVLLETHDGSLADDPALLVRLVEDLALPNVGLLYQPTFFEPQGAFDQFRLQKHLIRHLHCQNRNPDLSFATLKDGVIPWPEIFGQLPAGVNATIEFVPVGICSPAEFDLDATLQQARAETDYVRSSTPSR